jgi:Xaa-Pro aminopeptidase
MVASITANEYHDRVRALQHYLIESQISAALVTSVPNVYYLSGFRHYVPIRPMMVVIPAAGTPVLLAPKIEFEYAGITSWIKDVRYYVEFPEPGRRADGAQLLADVLSEFGAERDVLGIENSAITLEDVSRLSTALPNVSLADISVKLRRMRLIKSPAEIELIRQAGRVAAAEWEAALAMARPGVSEFEVALAARDAGIRLGASEYSEEEDEALSPILNGTQIFGASGQSSIPHHRASVRRLRPNDVVMMCFCLVNGFKGYRVGFTRHFSLGPVSDETRQLYDRVLEAQEACLEVVRPGATASQVDEVARGTLAKYDLEQYLTHRTGRGVGIDVAEGPELKDVDDTVLQAGMTFSVEPAVYIPGKIGFQIEDSVVVTENGYESLTPVEKTLRIL